MKARTKQHSLPSVLQHDASGLRAADPSNKASMLMDYFQTVYACPDDEPESVLPQVLPSDLYTMPAIEMDSNEVWRELKNIDISKACRPDNLPGLVLKTCADDLCHPLLYLFRRSLCEGIFPSH